MALCLLVHLCVEHAFLITGRLLRLGTETGYSYDQYWIGVQSQDHVILRIKACKDAHILLSETFEDTGSVYEVALGMQGENTKCLKMSLYEFTVQTKVTVSVG